MDEMTREKKHVQGHTEIELHSSARKLCSNDVLFNFPDRLKLEMFQIGDYVSTSYRGVIALFWACKWADSMYIWNKRYFNNKQWNTKLFAVALSWLFKKELVR